MSGTTGEGSGTDLDGTTTLAWSSGGDVRAVSLWFDEAEAEAPVPPREPLDGDTTADVVVVGAGLTGLWTAYYLLEADPALDVLVVDAAVAGYGASGRTGGWASAGSPATADRVAALEGPEAARSLRAALRDAVVEVGGVAAAELIDCDLAVGGLVTVARTPAQLARLRAEAASAHAWDDEVELLTPAEAATLVPGALGGTFTPDAARLQPVRLVRGLADVVTARSARLAEGTRALRVSPRALVTDQGTVRARSVVVTTGAGVLDPRVHPASTGRVHAIATEPLPAETWRAVGLERGRVLADATHRPVRVVRTGDDRLVLSGRSGSSSPGHDQDPGATRRLRAVLADLVPAAAGATITHAWGGAAAPATDGRLALGLDPATGIAWADGHGDDGVVAANLTGRTLADLVVGADTALTRLPRVGTRPAPGVLGRAGSGARAVLTGIAGRTGIADVEERLTGRPSRLAELLGR
ncbi:NAD(P)/FAD-dependent oxidoreductase [Cellulomonas sp. Marseille-Q8402]